MAVRLVQLLDALVVLVSNGCDVESNKLRLAVRWRQAGKVCQPGPHIYVHGGVLRSSKLGAVVGVHLLLKLDGAAAQLACHHSYQHCAQSYPKERCASSTCCNVFDSSFWLV